MRLAIDIETTPAPGWETYEDAALDFNRNHITLIATYDGTTGRVFRDVGALNDYLATLPVGTRFVLHHGKFDIKKLKKEGALLDFDSLHEDTSLMGLALPDKIPDAWMVQYGVRRKEANKLLGQNVHRDAGPNSLKTLAPYHLGVAPFWEVANHDNEEYALKDAAYTWRLSYVLEEKLKAAGAYDFYQKHLLPWARLIMKAEYRGIMIDNDLMAKMEAQSAIDAEATGRQLDEIWAGAHAAYYKLGVEEVYRRYDAMAEVAVTKLKNKTPERIVHLKSRYAIMAGKARDKVPAKINLGSPDQMAWLLKEYLQLDITTFNGKEESTGAPVLKRLAGTSPDLKVLLAHRGHTKLLNAFYPSYREMQVKGGIIHCNFNMDIARTGRLSSSGPNLQQVSKKLHPLFRARPGRKLICYDLSAIEPTVIAFLTEDPVLCDLLINGGNFHSNNVRIFLGINATDAEIKVKYQNERAMVKEVALALFYGAGGERIRECAQKYGFIWTKQYCRAVHQRFKETYETVFTYKRDLDRALERGATMQNVMGRILRIPQPSDVYMQGFNTLIQSSASDMLLDAARRADDKLEGKADLELLVHDEVLFEADEVDAEPAARTIRECMEAFKLPTSYGMVPVVAEGGINDCWTKG